MKTISLTRKIMRITLMSITVIFILGGVTGVVWKVYDIIVQPTVYTKLDDNWSYDKEAYERDLQESSNRYANAECWANPDYEGEEKQGVTF